MRKLRCLHGSVLVVFCARIHACSAVGVFFFPYRYIALVLLLAQTTSVVLFMRYSLKPNSNEKPYIKTTAVVMAELFKLVASIFLLGYERQSTVFDLLIYLKLEVIDNWRQSVLLGVPVSRWVEHAPIPHPAAPARCPMTAAELTCPLPTLMPFFFFFFSDAPRRLVCTRSRTTCFTSPCRTSTAPRIR